MRNIFVYVALTMLLSGSVATAQQKIGEKPINIVIIYADDLGYGDLGCYGDRPSVTPHLDRLASEGVRFTDFYSAQPVCSASRAGLLTGCYPNRLQIVGALSPQQNYGLSHGEMTLAQLLKQKQYATAIFGKWHLGHHPNFLPNTFGFDEYFGLPYSNDMSPAPEDNPGGPPKTQFPPLPLIDGNTTVATSPDQSQLTTLYTERAVKFIDEYHDEPFFLYVPHSMPHVPIRVSSKFDGKTGRGLYHDVIAEIDWSVGQILDRLDHHKLADRTLVVFSSDNGPWKVFGNHGGSPGPLRESKGTVYEGGIRVPCIARLPGRIPSGTVVREPAIMIDWFPTIAKLTGTKLPDHPIDGLDISPLLTQIGATSPHDAFYFYYRDNELEAMRSGQWKLLFPHEVQSTEGIVLGKDGVAGKGVRRKIGLELYDLSKDVSEVNNLAEARPEIVAELEKKANAMRDELGDRLQMKTGRAVRPHEEFPKKQQ